MVPDQLDIRTSLASVRPKETASTATFQLFEQAHEANMICYLPAP